MMSDAFNHRPQILLVISNDFGELATALDFVAEQPFDATLALPPRLWAVAGPLPVPTFQYNGPPELLAWIERNRPSVVFVCSGYLLTANRVLSVEQLRQLMDGLLSRCRVVTTDPFLGMLDAVEPSSFHQAPPRAQAMAALFRQVAAILRPAGHLYPVAVPERAGRRCFSFFNPAMVLRQDRLAQLPDVLGQSLAIDAAKKRWTFVLSAEDSGLLATIHGERAPAYVADKLLRAAAADRQPVLVAPEPVVAAVRAAAGTLPGAIYLPFCGHSLFRTLCLEAEYVFYWNAFSNSILSRVANGLPVILLDKGHLARSMPALDERGMRIYYRGIRLPWLTPNEAFDEPTLHAVATEQERPFADLMATYRALPRPTEVVSGVLSA